MAIEMKTLTVDGQTFEIVDASARSNIERNNNALEGKVNNSGWAANKFLGTDSAGNIVAKDAPSSGGGSEDVVAGGGFVAQPEPPEDTSLLWIDTDDNTGDGTGGGDYILPVANKDLLGGVKPVDKTSDMTQEVGVDTDGRLFTTPGSGGSGGSSGSVSWNDITDKPFYEASKLIDYDWQNEYTERVTLTNPSISSHLAKVSSDTPTKEDFVGKTIVLVAEQGSQEMEQEIPIPGNALENISDNSFAVGDFAFVIHEEALSLDFMGEPDVTLTRGIWCADGWENSPIIIKHLSVAGGEGKPIPDELLPEDVVKSVGDPMRILNVKINYGNNTSELLLDKTFLEIAIAFQSGAYVIASWENPMFFGSYQLVGSGNDYLHFARVKAGFLGLVTNTSQPYDPVNDGMPYIGYDAFILRDDDTIERFGDENYTSTVLETLYVETNDGATYQFQDANGYAKWQEARYKKCLTLEYEGRKFQPNGGASFVCTYIEDGKWYTEILEIKSETQILSTKIELGGSGGGSYLDAEEAVF